MRDFIVLIFLLYLCGVSIWRPWLGVLSLAVFSYLNPHSFAWGFALSFPAFQILFFVVLFSYFKTNDKQKLPSDWRVKGFIILWFYFVFTTIFAFIPDAAQVKLLEVTKIFVPFFFTLTLINNRQKLFYLIITIASSIGLIATKGGLFALATGMSYRIYGPPKTQFTGNNEFAVAVLIIIPMLILWYRETEKKWVRTGLLGVIPLCVIASISSWSRGALLALIATGLVIVWSSKRKALLIPIIVISTLVSIPYLPEKWFSRMDTIETYEQDQSALGRLEVWRDGWNNTLEYPFTGAGFEGWRYVSMRDWHSSYVEMFSEHGFIAFALWLSLIVGSVISLTRLPNQTKEFPELNWVTNYCHMIRASFVAYMVGTAFLGLSYWDILYHLIFISVLIKKFALEELAELKKQDLSHTLKIRETER
mgnify:FL=1